MHETKDINIESVKKMRSGSFLINDTLLLTDLVLGDNGQFTVNASYDEEVLTERDAEILIGQFIGEALADQETTLEPQQ